MSQANSYSLAFAAMGMLYLALMVYRRAPDQPVNRLFSSHAFASACWCTAVLLIMTAPEELTRVFIHFAHIPGAVGAATFVDFAFVFPGGLRYARRLRRLIIHALGIGVGVFVASMPALTTSVQVETDWVNVQYGWPIAVFQAYMIGMVGYGYYVLGRKWRTCSGLQRVQLAYVLIGLALAHGTGMLFTLFLPLLQGDTRMSGWAPVGYILAIGLIAYAVARHRLLDLATAFRYWAPYAVSAVTLIVAAFGGTSLMKAGLPPELTRAYPEHWLVAAFVVAGVLGVAVHSVTREIIESRFERHESNVLHSLRRASRRLAEMTQPAAVCRLVAESAVSLGEVSWACIYTRAGEGKDMALQGCAGLSAGNPGPPPTLAAHNPLLSAAEASSEPLYRDDILRFRPLAEAKQLSAAMDALGAEVCVPIRSGSDLRGILCTGARSGGRMYHWAELDVLDSLCLQAGLSLHNARLYAQVLALKELFEMTLRQMESGVIAIDERANITLFNPAACRVLGVHEHRVLGHGLDQLPQAVRRPLRAAHDEGRAQAKEKGLIVRRDGTRVPVTYSVSLLSDAEGGYRGAVMVLDDMSVHEALEAKRREAERLAVIRVLSAGMAHEIRNPLVAVRTFIDLAPTRLSDPEFRSTFVKVAREETERIDKLVSDLMMFARPQSAARLPTDLNALVLNVLTSLSATAERRGIELRFTECDSIPRVYIDDSRLRQAIVNIVLNATQASPEGGVVEVAIELTSGGGDNGSPEGATDSIRISVRNDGAPIPEEDMPHLFEPFFTTKSSGTGLGLAVSQAIMEEHGGAIEVRSTATEGTQFTLILPIQEPTEVERVEGGVSVG